MKLDMTQWSPILLLLCCGVLSALTRAQANSGVVVRLSQSALDYTGQRAIRLLSDHVRNGVSIPDASGSSGDMSYTLTNLHVKNFQPPRSSVSVNSGVGVNWILRGADVTAGGNWRYRYNHRWFSFGDSGSFTSSLSDISIDIRVSLGLTGSRPTIRMLGCSSQIGRAQATFSGSVVSWLYNILYQFVEEQVKSEISDALCKAVKRTIETDGTRELGNLQTEFRFLNTMILDYSLVRSPYYGSSYVESFHKGQFRWPGDSQGPPFYPSSMQRHSSSSMVSIYVSDYVINTFAYFMHKHGQLSYKFTSANLPAGASNVLALSCTFGTICLGNVFSDFATTYPNSSAELFTNSVRPPTVRISPGEVQIQLEGRMMVAVNGNDRRRVDLLAILFRAVVRVSAWIENDKVVGRVLNASVSNVNTTNLQQSSDSSSTSPDFMLSIFNGFIGEFMKNKIEDEINRAAAIGFQLPKFSEINFIRPKLNMREGFILVETEVAYRE